MFKNYLLKFETTFWHKIKYAISLYRITSCSKKNLTFDKRRIFTITFRSQITADNLDTKKFYNNTI